MSSAVYLDSSALVKLIVREPESAVLRRHLRRRRPWVSSALARTEVLRAVHAGGEGAYRQGRRVLSRCDLVRVSDRILGDAGVLGPIHLRSLDAIHLATADLVRSEIAAVITYDERMADAATERGHRVATPR